MRMQMKYCLVSTDIMDALIDTASRETDLENVYKNNGDGVSWKEVMEARNCWFLEDEIDTMITIKDVEENLT